MKTHWFTLSCAFILCISCVAVDTDPQPDSLEPRNHQKEYQHEYDETFYYDYGPGFYTDPGTFHDQQEDWFYDYSERSFRHGNGQKDYDEDVDIYDYEHLLPETDFEPESLKD